MFRLVALAVLLGSGASDPPIDARKSPDYKIRPRTREDYNHLRMPAHGTVYKGMLYGSFDDDWAHTNMDGVPLGSGRCGLDAIPIGGIAKKNWKKYTLYPGEFNLRHHVGYGALWFSGREGFLNKWDFHRIQEIEDSISRPTDARGINMIISGIPLLESMKKVDKIAQAAIDAKEYFPLGGEPRPLVDLIAFDSVPISKDSCRTFLLNKKKKSFESWDTEGAVFYKVSEPKGPLPTVRNLDTFDSPFTEDFYAFILKNDYYFVTESGKLYHAPPAKKGEKSRTMKALWDDSNRPIVGVIEDADNDKVWLFTKGGKKFGTQGVYFEMAAEIRQEKFDHAKLAPVNVEGRARSLLEYLPLIRDKAKKQQ